MTIIVKLLINVLCSPAMYDELFPIKYPYSIRKHC